MKDPFGIGLDMDSLYIGIIAGVELTLLVLGVLSFICEREIPKKPYPDDPKQYLEKVVWHDK